MCVNLSCVDSRKALSRLNGKVLTGEECDGMVGWGQYAGPGWVTDASGGGDSGNGSHTSGLIF